MKRYLPFLIIFFCLIAVPPALAEDNVTNMSTNVTLPLPLILSFQGGHMFGENPIEIINNQTGRIAFIGNTSSKGIELPPDVGYYIRVEPSGISDAINAPDAGVLGAMKWAEKNPMGTFIGATLLAIIMIWIKRK